MFLSFFIWLTQVLAHGIYDFHFGMWDICFDFLVSALVATCGIQFPEQELNLGSLPWECGVLATGPPEKSLVLICLMIYISGEKSSLKRCIQSVFSEKRQSKAGMLRGCMFREKGMDTRTDTTNTCI